MACYDESFDSFFNEDSGKNPGKKELLRQKMIQQLQAGGKILHPAKADGKKIAKSFWGYSWVRHIETYQDYESRLPGGRSLLRNQGVLDLEINGNLVDALVFDRELYQVQIRIAEAETECLKRIQNCCAGKINSLLDLIQGNLSEDVLKILSDPEEGLFPQVHEIRFICNCLDDSLLCKHAAAVLYGIGPALDQKPDLFFSLRGIDYTMLSAGIDMKQLTTDFTDSAPLEISGKIDLEKTFGIQLDSGISDKELEDLLKGNL